MNDFAKSEPFRLGNASSGWGEIFIQDLIEKDPSVLGLGDLVVKERERRHAGAGRLDFLLQDSPVRNRYAVEIQLGETNPSHIIRTIEYWDRERRRYPQFEHMAVIIAEEINGRFFNVISLFNQQIPIVAIKMTAFRVGDNRSIIFTRILDHASKVSDDEDEAGLPETNRMYWEQRTSSTVMQLADDVTELVREVQPDIVQKFNKGSIALKRGTDFHRFLTLWPKKKFVGMALPCPQSQTAEDALSSAEIDFDSYDELRGRYILKLRPADLAKNTSLVRTLISQIGTDEKDPAGDGDE